MFGGLGFCPFVSCRQTARLRINFGRIESIDQWPKILRDLIRAVLVRKEILQMTNTHSRNTLDEQKAANCYPSAHSLGHFIRSPNSRYPDNLISMSATSCFPQPSINQKLDSTTLKSTPKYENRSNAWGFNARTSARMVSATR